MNRPVTSASNIFRRNLCPGSERMEFGLPEDDSEQSREGRLLHDYAWRGELNRSFLTPNQRDLLERNQSLFKEIEDRIATQRRREQVRIQYEITLSNDMISGTPDCIVGYDDGDSAWINDAKFGYKTVERADLNLQLRAYAVLIYDNSKVKPNRVFVSITQPRAPYSERITLAEYSPEDIEKARDEIKAILEDAAEGDAPLIAGEEQCRYCKAKMICPEFQKSLSAPVLALRPQQDLSAAARQTYLEQKLSELSDEHLERVKIACAFADMIKSPTTDEIRKRIQNGGMIGYELGKPVNKREIVDAQKAIALLSLGKVVSRQDVLAICSLPIGQVEESYRKRTGCTWQEAREKIEKVLHSVIETTEMKPRVLKK
jgi:hypothetical protein